MINSDQGFVAIVAAEFEVHHSEVIGEDTLFGDDLTSHAGREALIADSHALPVAILADNGSDVTGVVVGGGAAEELDGVEAGLVRVRKGLVLRIKSVDEAPIRTELLRTPVTPSESVAESKGARAGAFGLLVRLSGDEGTAGEEGEQQRVRHPDDT